MSRYVLTALVAAAAAGCTSEPQVSVRILSPRDGAVLPADSVRVLLSAPGIAIVPADGTPTPGRAHHHLFLDTDLTSPEEAIPAGVHGIVHLGTGDSTYTLPRPAPGRHRLIAVLALGNHVPIQPWAVDTVAFSVQTAPPE